MLGFFMHCVNVIIINVYVNLSYLKENTEETTKINVILLAIGILYPWGYDFSQMIRGGLVDYFSDPWNYADMLYTYGSIVNCVI